REPRCGEELLLTVGEPIQPRNEQHATQSLNRVPRSASLGLQFALKHLLHFLKLGPDDDLTIRLPRVVREVILMVSFCAIKLGEGSNFRDDGAGKNSGRLELLLVVLRNTPLLVGVKENHRAVLWPRVVSLAIPRCRVMRLPKDFQQLLVGDHGWVKSDLS